MGSSDLDDLAQLETLVFNGKYGSLLNLGQLVFSSKTVEQSVTMRPKIDKLVKYMNESYSTFNRSVRGA